MVSEKFRYQLRQEVEQWQAEGLINQQLYETITHRYQFSALETSARNRFVMILLGLGSVLLGLAVITFVAANWQVWSRGVRVVLLLSLFVGVNTTRIPILSSSQSQFESSVLVRAQDCNLTRSQ